MIANPYWGIGVHIWFLVSCARGEIYWKWISCLRPSVAGYTNSRISGGEAEKDESVGVKRGGWMAPSSHQTRRDPVAHPPSPGTLYVIHFPVQFFPHATGQPHISGIADLHAPHQDVVVGDTVDIHAQHLLAHNDCPI